MGITSSAGVFSAAFRTLVLGLLGVFAFAFALPSAFFLGVLLAERAVENAGGSAAACAAVVAVAVAAAAAAAAAVAAADDAASGLAALFAASLLVGLAKQGRPRIPDVLSLRQQPDCGEGSLGVWLWWPLVVFLQLGLLLLAQVLLQQLLALLLLLLLLLLLIADVLVVLVFTREEIAVGEPIFRRRNELLRKHKRVLFLIVSRSMYHARKRDGALIGRG